MTTNDDVRVEQGLAELYQHTPPESNLTIRREQRVIRGVPSVLWHVMPSWVPPDKYGTGRTLGKALHAALLAVKEDTQWHSRKNSKP